MAGVVGSTLGSGITKEIKEYYENLSKKYMAKINSFYQKTAQITGITSQTLQPLMMKNNTIFDAMKNTQIREKDLDVAAGIQQARDLMIQQHAEQQLIKINTLLGEGYSILTELGEELRDGQQIQYLITYTGGKVLKQRVLNLEQFTSLFKLGNNGEITFTGITNKISKKEESFFSKEWSQMLKFQENQRKLYSKRVNKQKRKILYAIDKYMETKDNSFLQIITEPRVKASIYRIINRKSNPVNNSEEALEQLLYNIQYQWFNKGRLIETAAKIKEKFGEELFDTIDIRNYYEEDNVEFWRSGDFIYKGIEYQSKLNNATVKLSSIINGMKQVTLYFSKYYNEISQIKSQAETDGDQAENQVYEELEKELLSMFT